MLSPQQITQFRTQAGLSPNALAPTTSGSNDIIAQRKLALGMTDTPTTPVGADSVTGQPRENPVMNMLNTMSSTIVNQGQEAVKNVQTAISPNPNNSTDYGSQTGNVIADISKRLASLGHASMDVGQMALSPIGGFLSAIVPKATKDSYNQSVNWIADHITNNPQAQNFLSKANDFFDANPDAKEALLHDLPTVVQLIGMANSPTNPDVSLESLKSTLSDTTNSFINAWNKVTNMTPGDVSQGANNLIPHPLGDNGLLSGIKTSLASQNAEPKLEASANRIDNPVDLYDQYIKEAKTAATDVKADPPLSSVGEDIGDSFKKVVDMRRAVGKTMETELSKVGGIQTDITEPMTNLENELFNKQNLVYDNGKLVPTGESSMTAEDAQLMTRYIKGINNLGANPTVADLDSFIKRFTGDVDLYKSQNGITSVTNGERIIKGNLAELRDQFNPETTGNPDLTDYYNARQNYSQLSDFINEGSKYLGKITQSGDFARDASLAKSAVQSLLNNGKKDWLMQLEGITGDPVLDKSVLSLQAMSDAGDVRGESLLKMLSDNPPVTKSGFINSMIDYVMGKVKSAVVGSPEEQTRTYLQSLNNQSNSPTPMSQGNETASQITPTNMANTSNPANNRVISPNTTTEPPNMQAGFIRNPLGSDETPPNGDNMQVISTPKADSVESLGEQAGGWKAGMKQTFDTALNTKNATLVQKLLPEVPPEYLLRFSKEINKLLTPLNKGYE